MKKIEINKYIDHTLLRPETTREQVIRACHEAREHRFASVCVNSWFAGLVAQHLAGAESKTCVCVGFPLGASSTAAKIAETGEAIGRGAQEIDMVINIGAQKSGDLEYVRNDIAGVVACAAPRAIVKVIFETCLMGDDEITALCDISAGAGAHFVKTSTGFNTGGATVEHVRLMRAAVGDRLGVKASGGIRSLQTALDMIHAGANRIGTSSGIQIMHELLSSV
jgi:deoxyribose-phosphate aldolase